jgi:hypothetical protein
MQVAQDSGGNTVELSDSDAREFVLVFSNDCISCSSCEVQIECFVSIWPQCSTSSVTLIKTVIIDQLIQKLKGDSNRQTI